MGLPTFRAWFRMASKMIPLLSPALPRRWEISARTPLRLFQHSSER